MRSKLSRRQFLAGSTAVSAMALGLESVQAQTPDRSIPKKWDLEADVIVVGAGAAGIPVAIQAREAGLSVIVVEGNYDIGGHAIVSMANTLLGGGTAHQKKYGIEDSPEQFFKDLTDWSVTLTNGYPEYRYNDREQAWQLAYNSVPTYDWLVSLGLPFLDKAPDNHGAQGAGLGAPRELHFAWTQGTGPASPNGKPGAALMRPLEDVARRQGAKFLLNYYMDSLVQEAGEDGKPGRVLGLRAHYTPRVLPDGTKLKSFRSDGNIELEEPNLTIRAKKAVVLATAGYTSNVDLRRIEDPRLTKEFACAAQDYSYQDGSGTLAALDCGGTLWGMANAFTERPVILTRGAVVGVHDTYTAWSRQSPLFPLIKHTGVPLRDWQNAIVVNWVGKRFYDETVRVDSDKSDKNGVHYGLTAGTRGLVRDTNAKYWPDMKENPYVVGDWRNIHRTNYQPVSFIHAALAVNEGTQAPDFSSGPQWAILDSEGVKRERMRTDETHVDPAFFFKADTLEELAEKINTNPFMSFKMKGDALKATVDRYNQFVDAGKDADFGKEDLRYKIETPPFYAAWTSVTMHDCYGGIRVDKDCNVLTTRGDVIPGLMAAGEVTGGSSMHGLSRGLIQAYIVGKSFKNT